MADDQKTLILIKPDGVARGLTGQILARIEAKGYRLARVEQRAARPEELAAHYAEHEGKPFYQPLVDFMSEGDLVAVVAEGHGVIPGFRSLAGATDRTAAAPGTIRGDFALTVGELAPSLDSALALNDACYQRSRGDEVNEFTEERLVLVLCVVLLSGLTVCGAQVHLDQLEALTLNAGDDLSDVAVCNAVWLNQNQCTFSHVSIPY